MVCVWADNLVDTKDAQKVCRRDTMMADGMVVHWGDAMVEKLDYMKDVQWG